MTAVSALRAAGTTLLVVAAACAAIVPVHGAADSLSVTVTPPLFQLAIGPGESWSSTVKIVNTNRSEVTYYAQVVDFEASGEEGTSSFRPVVEDAQDPTAQGSSLAQWVTLQASSVTVPAGRSGELPFSIIVPENAEPGGHYAAILVGTQPAGATSTGAQVKVSSYVSSLLFVRIKGDVVENGRIRELIAGRSLYEVPEVDFLLRFENTGTTHLKPVGDIVIYNMWGKERGTVVLNQGNGNFGNVLPGSVRRFQFTWKGEADLFDIGLHSAVATLVYGDEAKRTVSATTYFWVVPIVPVSIAVTSLFAFIVLVAWLIRRYIRRALVLERMRHGIEVPVRNEPSVTAPSVASLAPIPTPTLTLLMEPIREGVIDLRSAARGTSVPAVPASTDAPASTPVVSWHGLVAKYRLFILFIAALIVGGYAGMRYFDRALVPERQFQITDVTIQEEPVVPVAR